MSRPSDVQQWPSGQTEAAKLAKGRAKSELRNVAPAAGRRPQKMSIEKKDLGEYKQALGVYV